MEFEVGTPVEILFNYSLVYQLKENRQYFGTIINKRKVKINDLNRTTILYTIDTVAGIEFIYYDLKAIN